MTCFVFVVFISNRRYRTAHTSHKRPNFMMALCVLAKTLHIPIIGEKHRCDTAMLDQL